MDTILFDATGTLLTLRRRVGEVYAEVGATHGLELDPDLLQQSFEAAFDAAPPLAFPGTPAGEREAAERAWWRRVVRGTLAGAARLPAKEPLFEPFFDELYRTFASAGAWRVAPEAGRVLATLRTRGYLLGVLSNFDSRLPGLLAALTLAGYFAAIATSASLGAAKPDPRSFRGALALIGSAPEAAAYVGDSPHRDAAGSARAGLLPVLRGASLPEGVTGLAIERLADLLNLFPCRPGS